jgi:uncharacterized protein YjbI with pentapeptide repeats
LEGGNFEGVKLKASSFSTYNLSTANFKEAKMIFGGFRECNLSNTNFTGSNFESWGFDRSTLKGTNFDGAHLFRVSMVKNIDQDKASLDNATKEESSGMGWFS